MSFLQHCVAEVADGHACVLAEGTYHARIGHTYMPKLHTSFPHTLLTLVAYAHTIRICFFLQVRTEYGVLPADHPKRTEAQLDSAVTMLEAGNPTSGADSVLKPMMEQNDQVACIGSRSLFLCEPCCCQMSFCVSQHKDPFMDQGVAYPHGNHTHRVHMAFSALQRHHLWWTKDQGVIRMRLAAPAIYHLHQPLCADLFG